MKWLSCDVVNIEIDLEKKYVKTSLVTFGRDSLGEWPQNC